MSRPAEVIARDVGLEHLAQGFPVFVGHGTESEIKSSKTAFKVGDIEAEARETDKALREIPGKIGV